MLKASQFACSAVAGPGRSNCDASSVVMVGLARLGVFDRELFKFDHFVVIPEYGGEASNVIPSRPQHTVTVIYFSRIDEGRFETT